jgi:predicted DsbA family dithiol-disulfide isomerase
VHVEWRAYELRPDQPPEGLPRIPNPGEVNGIQPPFIGRAEEAGLKIKLPPIIPCSRPALEVAEYAKRQGKFDQFHLAVFKAFWEESKNIGLRSVLFEIVRECGIDPGGVERCLDEGRYTPVVIKQSEDAKRLGINGIPAYIIGDCIIEGIQPYQVFQRAIETALRK